MSAFSHVQDRVVSRVRHATADVPEVRFLMRFMGVLVFVTFAAAVHLWARMGVRTTAIQLDQVHSELGREMTMRDRLLVERTMLRSPGRLGGVATSHGLVAPVDVVDVVLTSVAPQQDVQP